MSQSPLEVTVDVLNGKLLNELMETNFSPPPQNVPSGKPENDPPRRIGICKSRYTATLDEPALRDYVDLTERIHQFELLTLYQFLEASDKKGFADHVRRELLKVGRFPTADTSPINVDATLWESLPKEWLCHYVDLSNTIRTFVLIVSYRWLREERRADIAAEVAARLKDFYNKLIVLIGDPAETGCNPGCGDPPECKGCRVVCPPPPPPRP